MTTHRGETDILFKTNALLSFFSNLSDGSIGWDDEAWGLLSTLYCLSF